MAGIINNEMMIILYASKQEAAKDFYEQLLEMPPRLNVPGMTEFQISDNVVLGIMPGDGIVRILEGKVENPNNNVRTPRCELYLYVEDPVLCLDKLTALGGKELSGEQQRNWGDFVAYGFDLDNNIIAFARKSGRTTEEG